MCMHIKYGGLIREVTGVFTHDVFKCVFTPIILGRFVLQSIPHVRRG